MNGKTKDGIKIALPLVIQLLVIVGGGIAIFWQTTSTLQADVQRSKAEIINKVDRTEDKVDDVQEDVDDLQLEQKVMKEEILEAVDMDLDNQMLKHKVKCHNKKSSKCDPG